MLPPLLVQAVNTAIYDINSYCHTLKKNSHGTCGVAIQPIEHWKNKEVADLFLRILKYRFTKTLHQYEASVNAARLIPDKPSDTE